MKKLPFCTLVGGAVFAIAGAVTLLVLARLREPTLLFIPLIWDIVMVAIGAGIVLRFGCARRIGGIWGIFCVAASLLVGAAVFTRVLPQQSDSTTIGRMIFALVAVAFGVVYGIWQLTAFYSHAHRAWCAASAASHPVDPQHG